MDFSKLFENKGMIAAAVVVFFLLIFLFKRGGGSSSGGVQTLYYGSGLSPQQAVELANNEINASVVNRQTNAGLTANLANIAALRDVNLSSITNATAVQQAQIAANQAAVVNTNQTNVELANVGAAAAEQIALTQANTEENIAAQAAPSPLQRWLGALGTFSQQTGFSGQFGNGAFGDLTSLVGKFFGGGAGGGGLGGFSLGGFGGSL